MKRSLLIVCVLSFSIFLLSVYAQSQSTTVQPVPSTPPHMNVSSAYVVGYVLDEDGKTVPLANVSLWWYGHLWDAHLALLTLFPSDNPQTTRIAFTDGTYDVDHLTEGGFRFGYVGPGDYTVKAEKEGYNSSVSIHIGEDTTSPSQMDMVPHPIWVNLTLDGYRVPTLTPSQRANTGAIIGNIIVMNIEGHPGFYTNGVVSLWLDGQMVKLPNNPQKAIGRDYAGKEVDYTFEHLAPGYYTVKVTYQGFEITDEDTASVDVGTGVVTADVLLTNTPPLPQPITSALSPSPSQTNDHSSARPTPALPGLVTLLVVGFVTYYLANKKSKL